ncbi:TetR/AcrR family transcriptional regulator [Bacillus sp. B15-48]|uniref:TetR/AcrR family transcriptional regulator n=1 Tax=Bacillus sp. B15-48 TaxID=1548601 RepID=UPI00193F53C1|nr:TetR/AcrR family transcriptional regulator [Bacillus sp. B15-48]MBM4761564.1 TetR family transcriptional regulator [Bacillus sp. B15-48]
MKREVYASVKDERLIKKRRDQMIKGAVNLFKEKGFHRTTTREIASASGFSIGTLYEYIRKKEDILYLVVDRMYDEIRDQLQKDLDTNQGTVASLKRGIFFYFQQMAEMEEEVLVMYQEAKSLTKDTLPSVLNKEIAMVGMFEDVIKSCVDKGELHLTESQIKMIAHNIFVQGQMWAFRRWALQKEFSLQEYIDLQIDLLFHGMKQTK